MKKVTFVEYQEVKNEILFGKNFKEYSELKENGIIAKEYCTEDGHNFYEINDNGKIEFWSTKHGESRIYEETVKNEEIKTEIFGVDCYQITENIFEIRLMNDKVITVRVSVKHPEMETIWNYKIDNSYFDEWSYARKYVQQLIAEKLTGSRIIFHTKRPVPDICGIEGRACRHPKKCNTMLCSNCPIAEQFFADKDGVKLVYAIR